MADTAEERPQEHVVLGERTREDQGDEDTDRDAEQPATQQPRTPGRHQHDCAEERDREQGARGRRPGARPGRSTIKGSSAPRRRAGSPNRCFEHVGDDRIDSPVPEQHPASTLAEGGVHEQIGVDILLAHLSQIDHLVRLEERLGFRVQRAKVGCLIRHTPSGWRITSIESARTCTTRAPNGRAACRPAITARYSATLLVATPIRSLTAASRVGGSVVGSVTTAPIAAGPGFRTTVTEDRHLVVTVHGRDAAAVVTERQRSVTPLAGSGRPPSRDGEMTALTGHARESGRADPVPALAAPFELETRPVSIDPAISSRRSAPMRPLRPAHARGLRGHAAALRPDSSDARRHRGRRRSRRGARCSIADKLTVLDLR